MNRDEEKLWKIMLDVVADETGLAGVPLKIVERRMKEQAHSQGMICDDSNIQGCINGALHEWVIDKTLDELSHEKMQELSLPEESGYIWHLKLLTKEKTEVYRSLRPETQALIRILREQNGPKRRGEIPKEVAIKKLTKQGFSEDDLKHIYAKDTIEDLITSWGDEHSVWTYGLVKEYEKTEEFKQLHEEMMEKAAEKEARRYRFTEECETTDPIHGRLDELAKLRWDDLETLEEKKENMDEEEYLRQKDVIEKRDADEEAQWNQIIEMVYKLPFDTLIDLRNLLWKKLPTPEYVLDFLDKKSKEKKNS